MVSSSRENSDPFPSAVVVFRRWGSPTLPKGADAAGWREWCSTGPHKAGSSLFSGQRWMMEEAMTTVGVRVPDSLRKWLDQEAEKRGVTRSECFRQLAEEARNDQKNRLLMEAVQDVKQFLLLMDQRWKIGLVALLVDAGKASPDEAEAFVREDLS
jgi:hypothetical protein